MNKDESLKMVHKKHLNLPVYAIDVEDFCGTGHRVSVIKCKDTKKGGLLHDVLVFLSGYIYKDQEKAAVDFVVRACNSHNELIDALEVAIEEAERGKQFARELSRQTIEGNLLFPKSILNKAKRNK